MDLELNQATSVKLTRLDSTNKNLRTPTVNGLCPHLPKVGESFTLYAESLSAPGEGFRLIQTSRVTEVTPLFDGVINFRTLNSKYSLEVFGDEEEE